MPGPIVADTFFQRYDHQLVAALTLLVSFGLLVFVNRWLTNRGRRLAAAVTGVQLSSEADTRLRLLRRIVDMVIVVIAVGLALSQFTALDRVAGTILASSAIAAAVIGFAARQVVANAIAGVLLAVTQPLRIGDVVTFEGDTGVVEDVRLSSTWLRTGNDSRVIIPNERLAQGVLRNDSIIVPQVAVEVSIWVPATADPIGAVDALRAALRGIEVRLAESTAEGVRLLLVGEPAIPAERAVREAVLREEALRALRDEFAASASNT